MLAEYVGPTLNLSNIVVPGGALTTRSLTFNSSIYGYGDFAKDHITNLDGFLVSVQCAQYEGFEHAIERCFMYMSKYSEIVVIGYRTLTSRLCREYSGCI